MGGIMSLTGYVAGEAVQPESAIWGFKAIYIFIPIVLEIIGVVTVGFYDLDKKYSKIETDLTEGKYAPGVVAYFSEQEEASNEEANQGKNIEEENGGHEDEESERRG